MARDVHLGVELRESERRLFEEANFAHLATVCPDGHPHVSPVWVDLEDGLVRVNTASGRVKERNMRREPRVAISVHDTENPYKMVAVQGRVVDMTTEGANEHIDALSHKYKGRDYPDKTNRIVVRIRPERVASKGLGRR